MSLTGRDRRGRPDGCARQCRTVRGPGLEDAGGAHPGALEEALSRGADVVAVNTLSRHLEPATAAAIAGRVATRFVAAGARLLLKKIDSRMRGNVGAEVSAVARALDADAIVVAPAVPAQGRIVTSGTIRGAGVPAEGIDIRTGLAAAAAFRIEIPDSRSDDELDEVAASCLASAGRRVAVGAHGLAAALARQMGRTARLDRAWSWSRRFSSSSARRTRRPQSRLPRSPASAASPSSTEAWAACCRRRRGRRRTGDRDPSVPCAAGRGDEAAGASPTVPAAWCSALRPRTLLATGGDTAAALLDRLGCRVLEVGGEAAPGIPGRACRTGRSCSRSRAASVREAFLLDRSVLCP